MISHCFHLVSYGASQLVSVADTMTMRSNPVPFMKCAFGYTKASNRRYSVVEISPPVSKKTCFTSFMPQKPFASTWWGGCCYMVQHMYTKAAEHATKQYVRILFFQNVIFRFLTRCAGMCSWSFRCKNKRCCVQYPSIAAWCFATRW